MTELIELFEAAKALREDIFTRYPETRDDLSKVRCPHMRRLFAAVAAMEQPA